LKYLKKIKILKKKLKKVLRFKTVDLIDYVVRYLCKLYISL